MGRVGQGFNWWLKRTLDVIGALALLVIFGPLMLLIAACLRLRNGSPVIHAELRIGRDGQRFTLRKFRTLRVEPGSGSSIATEGDTRIVAMGLFLRRWRLDEFPQLFNILAGEMSLVGPRPLPEAHARALPQELLTELGQMPPGLTGPASIRFLAEDAVLNGRPDAEQRYLDTILPAKARVELDYLRHWSLWVDIQILLLTVLWVWSPRARARSSKRIQRLLAD